MKFEKMVNGNYLIEYTLARDDTGKEDTLIDINAKLALCINLLYMKEGTLPGLPDVFFDIDSYLHKYTKDIDIDSIVDEFKSKVNEFIPEINEFDVTGSLDDINGIIYLNMFIDDDIFIVLLNKSNGGLERIMVDKKNLNKKIEKGGY